MLGNTRSITVKSFLNDHNMDYEDYSELGFFEVTNGYSTKVQFGGIEWDNVEFHSVNDILSGAYFSKKFQSKNEYDNAISFPFTSFTKLSLRCSMRTAIESRLNAF